MDEYMNQENQSTLMVQEALESGAMLERQLARREQMMQLVAQVRAWSPEMFITVARGSSDHAACFFAYLVMRELGVLTVSLPPSLVTLHHAPLQVRHAVALGFSQSGASPDLVETLRYLDQSGAHTLACVNQADSPLEQVADAALPILAGQELSVAATKSCLGIMTLAVQWVASWKQDDDLWMQLMQLQQALSAAVEPDLPQALAVFGATQRVLVIGRGLSHSVALEAALKMKETCAIQSEAFSVAEVRHGPMRLIEANYALVVFVTPGEEQAQLVDFCIEMRGRGAHVLAVCAADQVSVDALKAQGVMVLDVLHRDAVLGSVVAPIAALQRFYLFVSQLAQYRGLNPDRPLFLNKVTQTH